MILNLLVILPITMLGIYLVNKKEEILIISQIGSILNQIQTLILIENYSIDNSRYQFNLYNIFGCDGLSLVLLWQIGILLPIIILNVNINKINKLKMILQISISYISILIFTLLDLLLFYITYEILLIPMYFLIGYFGSRNRKIQALYEFYIYTLIGSMILLIVILLIYSELGTTSFKTIHLHTFSSFKQSIIFFFLFLAFGFKIPIIPFHIWLPEAHVEASTPVSIYLAAILLKLGGYGLIRIAIGMFSLGINLTIISIIYTICIIGLIYSSIACITLWDIKKIIAYSSIGHMNLSVLGLMTNNIYGLNGNIYFMISHGLISSGLFILIGFIYDRYHTRILKYYKGLVMILPLYSLFLFILTLSNIAFPFTSGYLSEFFIFLSLFQNNPFIAILSTFAIVLTPLYGLWIYHKIIYGKQSNYIIPSQDISKKEINLIAPLVFFIFFLGIYPNFLLNLIEIVSYKYLF